MMKILIALVYISSLAFAEEHLYTGTYISNSGIVHPAIETGIPNQVDGERLMQKRVVFSASLYFEDGELESDSRQALQKLLEIIRKNGSKPYYISIIGHRSSFTSSDHSIELNFWSSFWHNMGNHSVSRDIISKRVNERIKAVYNLLQKNYIDKDRIYTENRMDRDPIATEAIEDGRKLNNRVTVTLYY